MINLIVRSAILYVVVVAVMRLMGKRQIGEMQPFELVISIMLAELAAIPLEDVGVPLFKGLIPIITLAFLHTVFSLLSLKSQKLRRLLCGTPVILIRDGNIQQQEMRSNQINLNDLLEQLRAKDILDPADVAYAILETNGQLSVFPKAGKKPATDGDVQANSPPVKLPIPLVMDGRTLSHNLPLIGQDEEWLIHSLKKAGYTDQNVFFAYMDAEGNLQIIPRKEEQAG
jgi:uncharacterized membrane protein YcaP (DUF421 family)